MRLLDTRKRDDSSNVHGKLKTYYHVTSYVFDAQPYTSLEHTNLRGEVDADIGQEVAVNAVHHIQGRTFREKEQLHVLCC